MTDPTPAALTRSDPPAALPVLGAAEDVRSAAAGFAPAPRRELAPKEGPFIAEAAPQAPAADETAPDQAVSAMLASVANLAAPVYGEVSMEPALALMATANDARGALVLAAAAPSEPLRLTAPPPAPEGLAPEALIDDEAVEETLDEGPASTPMRLAVAPPETFADDLPVDPVPTVDESEATKGGPATPVTDDEASSEAAATTDETWSKDENGEISAEELAAALAAPPGEAAPSLAPPPLPAERAAPPEDEKPVELSAEELAAALADEPGEAAPTAAPAPPPRPREVSSEPSELAVLAAPAPEKRPKSIKPTTVLGAKTVAAPKDQKKGGRPVAAARGATQSDGIELGDISLLGVFSNRSGRRALLRTPDGQIVRVSPGDQVDGWTVAAIAKSSIRINRDGESRNLKLPR